MKYLKAKNILPEKLIDEIQKYVEGDYIYIPRKEGKKKAWGEKSGTKEILKDRNKDIYKKYMEGTKISDLSLEYYLTEQSVRRIIKQEKAVIKFNT